MAILLKQDIIKLLDESLYHLYIDCNKCCALCLIRNNTKTRTDTDTKEIMDSMKIFESPLVLQCETELAFNVCFSLTYVYKLCKTICS